MDLKLELVLVPVSDVDPAKTFYIEKASFTLAVDHRVSDELRIVQPTPPGSACLTTASGSREHGRTLARAAARTSTSCTARTRPRMSVAKLSSIRIPSAARPMPWLRCSNSWSTSASVITASGYSAATGTRGPAESRADAVAGRYALPADARR